MTVTAADVDAALDRVVDPCSNAIGVPLGLGEMGLVTAVAIERGRVDVTLRLTSPCCTYGPTLARAVTTELAGVPGVTEAHVGIDHAATWTPAEMGSTATAVLHERRRRTIAVTGIHPHDWRDR